MPKPMLEKMVSALAALPPELRAAVLVEEDTDAAVLIWCSMGIAADLFALCKSSLLLDTTAE